MAWFFVKFRLSAAVLLLAVWSLTGVPAAAMETRQALARWVDNGSILMHDETGKVMLDYQSDRLLIPASLVKLFTALAALDMLGPDFRFRTELYLNPDGDLGVKGWGDPHLVSEEIHLAAEALRTKGVRQVRQIRLDQSAFAEKTLVSGQSNSLNPYDAINAALLVNFNTLFLGRHKDGSIYSAEPVTPLTPLSRELGKSLRPGTEERFNLSTEPRNVSRYAGELFAAILVAHGIAVRDGYAGGFTADGQWRLVHTHHNSASLQRVIQGLMKYSNNLIANQVFLVAGAETAGYPATLEKAGAVFRQYFGAHFPEYARETAIDEASGISRDSRMTAAAIMAVLESFRPWAELLDLRRGVLMKSGTLTGVYNYAGYITTAKGRRPFVILLNQQRNTRDLILNALKQL